MYAQGDLFIWCYRLDTFSAMFNAIHDVRCISKTFAQTLVWAVINMVNYKVQHIPLLRHLGIHVSYNFFSGPLQQLEMKLV